MIAIENIPLHQHIVGQRKLREKENMKFIFHRENEYKIRSLHESKVNSLEKRENVSRKCNEWTEKTHQSRFQESLSITEKTHLKAVKWITSFCSGFTILHSSSLALHNTLVHKLYCSGLTSYLFILWPPPLRWLPSE